MTLSDIMVPEIDTIPTNTQETETVELTPNEEIETVEEDNPYVNRIESLYSEGILGMTELPEEFKGKEFNAETTIELLEYALKHKDSSGLEEEKKKVFSDMVDGMSDLTRRAYEFELENNDPEEVKDFIRGLVFEHDIKALNPETHPEDVIREYHKAIKTPKAEVDELIADLKELNKLEVKAKDLKPKLDEKVSEIASKKLEEVKAFDQMERDALKGVDAKLTKVFEKGLGIKLDKEKETFLRGVLVNDEVLVPYKGKEIALSGAEYLVRYHKFSKDGNLEHLAKTLLFLQYPEEFEKQYAQKAQEKETTKFLKDHKVSQGVKTGNYSNADMEQPAKKNGLFLR
jgi:hypothetical protein